MHGSGVATGRTTRRRPACTDSALPGWFQPLAGRVYYGWIVLGAVSVTELVSWGILYYTFAVFVTPMAAELAWSPTALSGAFSVTLLCSGLAAIPVGRWLDRHGPRALMTTGSLAGEPAAGRLVAGCRALGVICRHGRPRRGVGDGAV